MNKAIISLDSVGTGFDPATGMTYALYQDGSYQLDSGIHVSDCTQEWRDALNEEDKLIIKTAMAQQLRTLDATGTGPMIVDFNLRELRAVDNPHHVIRFDELKDETKRDLRGLRAEFGPNEYIPALDD